jgi:hypothetical protein
MKDPRFPPSNVDDDTSRDLQAKRKSSPPRRLTNEELVAGEREMAAGLVEEVTGRHSLGRVIAEEVAKVASQQAAQMTATLAATQTPSRKPGWLEGITILAVMGAIATAAVAIFQAQVAYADHDTVVELKTLVPRLEKLIDRLEKQSAPSPAKATP